MMSTFNQHIKRTIALACIVAVFTVASQQSLAQEVQQPTSEGFPISLNSMVLFALYENPDINLLKAREEQTYYSIKEKEASYYPEVVLDVDGGREFNDRSERSACSAGRT